MTNTFTAEEVKQTNGTDPAFSTRLDVEEHETYKVLDTLLRKMETAELCAYPTSFMDALRLIDKSTLDMIQDKWYAFVPENQADTLEVCNTHDIPVVQSVGAGVYNDEYGLPVTILTKDHRILALWYHEGKYFLLGNGAEFDPRNILLINDRLERMRWRTGIERIGVTETNVIDRVKQRIAREAAEAAYQKKRNEFKNSIPVVKRRKAAKAAKKARRSNR